MIAWGAAAWVYRVYDARPHSLRDEFMRIARAMVLVAFAVFALIFFAQLGWVSRLLTGLYFVVAFGLVCTNRLLLRWLAHAAGTSPGTIRYYAVVGSGELAAEIIGKLRSHPEWGMKLAGFVLEEGDPGRRSQLRHPGAGSPSWGRCSRSTCSTTWSSRSRASGCTPSRTRSRSARSRASA